MKLESYLTSVINALRNDILPVLPTPESRDQMFNCLRVLTRLSLVVTPAMERRAAVLADENIPKDIREAFAGEPTQLDLPPVAEEISVTIGTLAGTKAAGDWLENSDWPHDPECKRVAQVLLGYEKQWRADSLAQMRASQRPEGGAEAETLSGQFLTQETLQEYLRSKLANPGLRVTEYKRVSGGRTRKTVVFKQEGHAAWPEWLVIQCDPKKGYVEFPGVLSQFPVISYAYQSGKMSVARPLIMEPGELPFGTPFMILEKRPGHPMVTGLDFFAKPPSSEALALDMARQLGALHSLSTKPMEGVLPVALPDETGWPGDLENLIALMKKSWNGPSMTLSAAFAWMRRHVDSVSDAKSIVHGDFNQHNLMIEGDRVSAVLDWEGVRISHPGHDIGYVRPLVQQMVPLDKFMAAYRQAGGHDLTKTEIDFFTLRAYMVVLQTIAHAHNMFTQGMTNDVRTAEVGCSLGAEFLRCIGDTLHNILRT